MIRRPGILRCAAAETLRGVIFGTRRVARFTAQSRRRTSFPVIFNEPIKWIPDERQHRNLSILSWAIPAVSWVAGAAPRRPGAVRLVTSERIVELPFAHRGLVSAEIMPPARILEFGCVHSRLELELASLGYEVTGVDLQPYPYQHPNLRVLLCRR